MTAARRWRLFPSFARAAPRADLLAGITLAAVALPEQLATGRLAGLTSSSGLLAFAAASLAFAVFGRNPVVSVGADSTIAPVFAAIVAAVAAAGQATAAATAATLAVMVGLILLAVRALRLDWVAGLLSRPVGTGLMTGVAIHILVGRLPELLQLDLSTGRLAGVVAGVWAHLGQGDALSLAIGLAVAAVCLAGERWLGHWPVPLAAIAAAAAVAGALDPAALRFNRVVAESIRIGGSLPALPSLQDLMTLLPVSLTVAFLCIAQTVVVEQGLPGDFPPDERPRVRANDVAAVGAANVLAGLAGAFPVNSSPPRSHIAAASGARSQLCSLFAVALSLAALFGAARLLNQIPVTALAGVLVFVAIRILPVDDLRELFRQSPTEGALALAATALVIALPIETGAALAIVLGLVHAAAAALRPRTDELLRVPGTTVWWSARSGERGERVPGVLVFGIGTPINFVTAPVILDSLDARLGTRGGTPKLIVLEAAGVIAVDFTGARLLAAHIGTLRAQGVKVALARLESEVAAEQAGRTGLLDAIGRDRVFLTVNEAIARMLPRPPVGTP